jgi:hypothetical protein
MAVLTAPLPLREQWDSSTAIAIPVTTKTLTQQVESYSLAAAANAAATTLALALNPNRLTYPTWITAGSIVIIDSYGTGLQETRTVASFAPATGILTLTAGLTNAHAIGANVQIAASQGAIGTTTFTFAAQQAPVTLSDRGIVLEILDLLDRAIREGSATAA